MSCYIQLLYTGYINFIFVLTMRSGSVPVVLSYQVALIQWKSACLKEVGGLLLRAYLGVLCSVQDTFPLLSTSSFPETCVHY